jgi:hypothetical protein
MGKTFTGRGRYDAGYWDKSLDGKMIWLAVSIRGPIKAHVVQLLAETIVNNPFRGVYRMIDARKTTGDTVYIYVQYSEDLLRWLNSEAAGAATPKKEVGGTQALSARPIDETELERSLDWISPGTTLNTMTEVKRCFLGQGFREQAVDTAQQIKDEGIKIIEFYNASITSAIVASEAERNYWVFDIDVGYLWGLITGESMGDEKDINRITTNSIEIMSQPQKAQIQLPFPALEDSPGLINENMLIAYIDGVDEAAKSFVESKFGSKDVTKIGAVENVAQPVQVPGPTEAGPAAETTAQLPKSILYKIEGYQLEFAHNGVVNVSVKISVDGKVYDTSKSLGGTLAGGTAWGKDSQSGARNQIQGLLTPKGVEAVTDAVGIRAEEMFSSQQVPYKDTSSTFARPATEGAPAVSHGRTNGTRFYVISNIDTNKMIQDNT